MGIRDISRKLCFQKRLSPRVKEIKKQLVRLDDSTRMEADLSTEEQEIVQRIKKETAEKNLNNVTRTRWYFNFYQRFPEIKWAFLGHMVSRNGGWNMTDLKGGLLPRLLSDDEQRNFFAFLERGNWLIFHDIYPQMLVYQESIKRNTNLFDLLPIFGVSKFMRVTWNHFWEQGDEELLAMALVINEQSYLEQRVMGNAHYQATVLDTLEFKLQDLLSLNQILFPYIDRKEIKIHGQTIHHFASLHERIQLGIRLYRILFGGNYPKFLRWASEQPHTGSRKDYWPMLFNDINEATPGKTFKRQIKDCHLKPGSHRIYSPKLAYAWKNVEHQEAERGDWYSNWKVVRYLEKYTQEVNGDIRNEYCETLERIELAIIAKEAIL